MRIRDPRWKTFGSGIWDKHPGSGTLHSILAVGSCCNEVEGRLNNKNIKGFYKKVFIA
jgi:hypothetical protein